METRSKARGGPVSTSEVVQARESPQNPPARSSSGSSLDLTVMWDDGVAGVVGPGHPAVRGNISAPGIASLERASATAEADIVREPEYNSDRRGSPSDDTVTEPRRLANPTIQIHVFASGPISTPLGVSPDFGLSSNSEPLWFRPVTDPLPLGVSPDFGRS